MNAMPTEVRREFRFLGTAVTDSYEHVWVGIETGLCLIRTANPLKPLNH